MARRRAPARRLIGPPCLAALLALATTAWGQARVDVCFGFGCLEQAVGVLDEALLQRQAQRLAAAGDAEAEREALRDAVAEIYRDLGRQTPIANDRPGNLANGPEVRGRMDCIDHSLTTTRILQVIEARGWLRYHRVLAPQLRRRFIFEHRAAALELLEAPPPVVVAGEGAGGAMNDLWSPNIGGEAPARRAPAPAAPTRFAFDTWYVEQGTPALVLPLEDWMNGEGPDVS